MWQISLSAGNKLTIGPYNLNRKNKTARQNSNHFEVTILCFFLIENENNETSENLGKTCDCVNSCWPRFKPSYAT